MCNTSAAEQQSGPATTPACPPLSGSRANPGSPAYANNIQAGAVRSAQASQTAVKWHVTGALQTPKPPWRACLPVCKGRGPGHIPRRCRLSRRFQKATAQQPVPLAAAGCAVGGILAVKSQRRLLCKCPCPLQRQLKRRPAIPAVYARHVRATALAAAGRRCTWHRLCSRCRRLHAPGEGAAGAGDSEQQTAAAGRRPRQQGETLAGRSLGHVGDKVRLQQW